MSRALAGLFASGSVDPPASIRPCGSVSSRQPGAGRHARWSCLNAFSKKFDNHCHALALYFVWYNFVKIHKAHKLAPAMAVTDKLSSIEDIVTLVEAAEPKPGKRGP